MNVFVIPLLWRGAV